MKKKTIIICIIAAGIAIAGGATLMLRKPKLPDLSDKTADQISEIMRSEQIQKLDPNERRAFMRDAFEERSVAQAREYAALSAAERAAYLDKVIDDMQAMREQFRARREQSQANRQNLQPRRNNPNAQQGRGGRSNGPERRRERLQRRDSTTRAQMSAFRQALMERMQQRGVQFGPGGGRGGRG